MWPFYLEEGVCLDEALHLDDSGGSLLDALHLDDSWGCRSRCGLLSGRGGLSR